MFLYTTPYTRLATIMNSNSKKPKNNTENCFSSKYNIA